MCWTGDDTAVRKIAERDFYVYKIGKIIWNNIFISDIRGHYYAPIRPNKQLIVLVQVFIEQTEDITLINGQLQTTLIQISDVYVWVVMIRI